MCQNADNGPADSQEGSGTKDKISTVKKIDGFILKVHDPASLDFVIESRSRTDKAVCHSTRGRFFPKSILYVDYILEARQRTDLLVECINSELRGDKALDMRFGSRFNQEKMCWEKD